VIARMTQRIRLPLTAQAPRRARRWAAAGVDLDPHRQEVLELLLSELVANSVQHSGYSPLGEVEILIRGTEGRIRVEVIDPGPGKDIGVAEAPFHAGLRTVDTLSDRWGVSHEPTKVWFELVAVGDPGRRLVS
jgi:anti-sigma regulatory factor (Ser/Thr protein kinase)